ncbi:maltose ABC transporter permease MalF [Niveibacterium terrae]|uniref:maltose ABC transporter permease MalF n=1 Tax=Niveibacterium terrae TaxID=3373598 RepID=UPI003A92302F
MESTRNLPLPGIRLSDLAGWLAGGLAAALSLYLCQRIYASGQILIAALAMLTLAASAIVFCLPKTRVWRFVLPGIFAAVAFIVFPIVYTVRISFTNYSFGHMLSFEGATAFLLDQSYLPEGGQRYGFTLLREGGRYRIEIEDENGARLGSTPFALPSPGKLLPLDVEPIDRPQGLSVVDTQTVVAHLDALKTLRLRLPHGPVLRLAGLNHFDAALPQYRREAGDLINLQTGERLHPNFTTGFYENPDGRVVTPGFKTTVGWSEYRELLFGPTLSGPVAQIFIWNVCFSALTVAISFAIGLGLAVLLNWEGLAGRKLYKTLYFLPSAIPLVISSVILKGLFDRQSGEINLLLNLMFGIRLDWFQDLDWARLMVLIVSSWLSFPYFLMMSMGMIKAIPPELYEASALAGASPLDNLRHITWPMVRRPFVPLLIASFTFNFNNAALITLLTRGGPAFADSQVDAGATDLLVSFTYAQTMRNGANFGLGAALSVLLFIVVGALAWASLRFSEKYMLEQP